MLSRVSSSSDHQAQLRPPMITQEPFLLECAPFSFSHLSPVITASVFISDSDFTQLVLPTSSLMRLYFCEPIPTTLTWIVYFSYLHLSALSWKLPLPRCQSQISNFLGEGHAGARVKLEAASTFPHSTWRSGELRWKVKGGPWEAGCKGQPGRFRTWELVQVPVWSNVVM